jgi:uncharacterized membrane protein
MKPRAWIASHSISLALAGLTLLAFLLRLASIDQSLFQDEFWTYGVVTGNSLTGVVSDVFSGKGAEASVTPPLHYLLAWVASQFGDPTIWIRVPSLILGTATVPAIYLLGRRIFGSAVGLLAAALLALSPFAIYYSTEARAYATLVFLVTLSTLALLRALDRAGRGWWIVYATSVCAALYTHYTAIFVVGAQALWAFWVYRDRFRTLLIVHVAIVLGYLPWVPGYLEQRRNNPNNIEAIGAIGLNTVGADLHPHEVSVGAFFPSVARILPGHPFLGLESIPGRAGVALVVLAGATAAVAAIVRLARNESPRHLRVHAPSVLIAILALATPLGLLAYGAVGPDLYTPRNMSASIPALAIVLGAFLTSGGRRVATVAAALVLAAFAIGAERTFDRDTQRPEFRRVAHFLDDAVGPGDRVVDQSRSELLGSQRESLGPLNPYLKHVQHVFSANEDDAPAWQTAARGGRVFFVRLQAGIYRGLPPLAGPDLRVVLRGVRTYPGLVRLSVGRYQGLVSGKLEGRGGHEVITWSLGKRIVVSGGATRGYVEGLSTAGRRLQVSGWATDAAGRRGVDWVLLFAGRRLLAAGWPRAPRADVAKSLGSGALISGFSLATPAMPHQRLPAPGRLRVFAVVGKRASEVTPAKRQAKAASAVHSGQPSGA